MKAIFTPFSIGIGLLAGVLAKKVFEALWGVVDHEQAPDSKYREINHATLVVACWPRVPSSG